MASFELLMLWNLIFTFRTRTMQEKYSNYDKNPINVILVCSQILRFPEPVFVILKAIPCAGVCIYAFTIFVSHVFKIPETVFGVSSRLSIYVFVCEWTRLHSNCTFDWPPILWMLYAIVPRTVYTGCFISSCKLKKFIIKKVTFVKKTSVFSNMIRGTLDFSPRIRKNDFKSNPKRAFTRHTETFYANEASNKIPAWEWIPP